MEPSPHHPFYELSLFSGGGGGVLAGHLLGWTTIGYVEIDKYCQQVIAQRIKDEIFKEAPIFTDVREFIQSGAVDEYEGFTDVVTAGFPCQPFSVAGKGKGKDDSRNLWPETVEIIRRVRPRYAFLENVPGLLTHKYIGRIFGELADAGYDARWCVLGADDVGAPHHRKRLWILAHSQSEFSDGVNDNTRVKLEREKTSESGNSGGSNDVADSISEYERMQSSRQRDGWKSDNRQERYKMGGFSSGLRDKSGTDVANTNSTQLERGGVPSRVHKEDPKSSSGSSDAEMANTQRIRQQGSRPSGDAIHSEASGEGETVESINGSGQDLWSVEPDVGRVANGVASRANGLKAIGNGQVPAVAATAWKILSEPNKSFN